VSHLAASVLVYAATLALHECVHGAVMRGFGARPTYGVMVVKRMLPVAYATASGHRFTLPQFIIVALAPLLTLSAASLALAVLVPSLGFYALVAFAGNFSGAVGDLWMAAVVYRFRRCRDVRVIDHKHGNTVESADPDARLVAARLERAGWRLTRLTMGSLVALLAIAWLGLPIAGWFGPADATSVLVGPVWFPLLEWTPDGIGFDPRNLLVASIVLALPTLLLPAPRQRRDADRAQGPDAPGIPALI
jgi:hypothetical protein